VILPPLVFPALIYGKTLKRENLEVVWAEFSTVS
jgi:hypothetical protein